MSVDHRDALLWPRRETFDEEDYSIGARTFVDNSNADINCKAESHMGCWIGSTPVKDSSPSSTEPTSMLSDKSCSRGTAETKNSEGTCFSSDTLDTEHPTSEGSLSPIPSQQNQLSSTLFSIERASSISHYLQNSTPDVSSQKTQQLEFSISSDIVVPPSSVTSVISKGHFSHNLSGNHFNEFPPAPTTNVRPPLCKSQTHRVNNPMSRWLHISKMDPPLCYNQPPCEYSRGNDCRNSDVIKFSSLSDVPVLKKPRSYIGESVCQSSTQKFPDCCPSSRPTKPCFWRTDGGLLGPPISQDSIEMRRRFAIRQMYKSAQIKRRIPDYYSREFPHQMPDHGLLPGYSYLNSYNEYSEQQRNMSIYSVSGGRFPDSSFRYGSGLCGPGQCGPSSAWSSDAQHYFSQPKPFVAALESPRKRSCTYTRGNKRKRAPSCTEVKLSSSKSATCVTETYDSLALCKLLSINAMQCVSWPELEDPIDICPPEPALKRKKLPCHEISENLDSSFVPDVPCRNTRKYASLPFILRSPGASNSLDLFSYFKNDKMFTLDSNENLLSNALTTAITRLGESRLLTVPPSPATGLNISDPLSLFSNEEVNSTSLVSEAVLLPPKRRRIPVSLISEFQANHQKEIKTSAPQFTLSSHSPRNLYKEKRITMEMLKSKTTPLHICRHCKVQILLSSGPVTISSSSSEVFCSQACMQVYHSISRPRRFSLTLQPSTSYVNPSMSTMELLIPFPASKLCKGTSKSSITSTSKCNPKVKDALARNAPSQRWKGSRWTYFPTNHPSRSGSSIHPLEDSFPQSAPGFFSFKILDNMSRPFKCSLCHRRAGEVDESIVGRFVNYTCNKWVHVNCILWCYGVSETGSGCFMHVAEAFDQAEYQLCKRCSLPGAGVPCFSSDCVYYYHFYCAYESGCSFHVDKSMFCPKHQDEAPLNTRLFDFNVKRRVYLDKDEYALVAEVIATQCLTNTGSRLCFRIGTLILDSLGQLLPEHLESGRFHNSSFIYPVGFSTTRIYWSFRRPSQRCFYICTISDSSQMLNNDNKDFIEDPPSSHPSPIFTVTVKEEGFPDICFKAADCSKLWQYILKLARDSRQKNMPFAIQLVCEKIKGEVLFGLSEPHIVRAIESLPGVEHISGYSFSFGKMQLISRMPVMINPTGCARSEPKRRNYTQCEDRELQHDGASGRNQLTNSSHLGYLRHLTHIPRYSSADSGPSTFFGCTIHPSNKQSPSMQYRVLQSEWRNNVLLARSTIQGLGLFASRDIERNEFIIEYLGQLIRNEVGNRRERLYETQSRGIYMFRADDNWIVDATMYGGLARYINHSCEPNCIAEVIIYDNQKRIIIIANRLIKKGEELTYDYKLDAETDKRNRIPCLCGAKLCRKWMN